MPVTTISHTLCGFVTTAVFFGLLTYKEGLGATVAFMAQSMLALVYAVGIYLNLGWISHRIPQRTYSLNLWRWRLVMERT